jgi:Flp pilus assembly pilin Flp
MIATLTVKTLTGIEELKRMFRDAEGGIVVEYGLLTGLLVLGLAAGFGVYTDTINAWMKTVADGVKAFGPIAPAG